MTTLAIDIDGTKLVAVLIGADGQIRDRRELPTSASQTPEVLRGALPTLVPPLQAHAQRVVIAPARIIYDGSLLAPSPHSLGGLLHFPLVKALEQLTDLLTIAINDAQAVAWAEYQTLEGDVTEMVFATIFAGVGGGVVGDDKLLTGPGDLAGHIGYTLTGLYGPVCGCGRTGYAEAVASGRGIAAVAQGELAGADVRIIFIRVGQGDKQAQWLIHRSTRASTRLIVDTKATTDCQCVVVGGSVGLVEGYLALVEMYLAQEPAVLHVDLLAVCYRHDAGLFGATPLVQGGKS